MQQPDPILALLPFALAALAIASFVLLKCWRGWLAVKRLQLALGPGRERGAPLPSPAGRIELADLRERVRKLEAIANGVEL